MDGDSAVSAASVSRQDGQPARNFTATAALPYEHLERATAGLRAELRWKLLAADVHKMPR